MDRIKVLYVEDEINLASIVQSTLIDSGYEVKTVNDGALVIGTAINFKPNICVLDIMLPNVDGLTIAKSLNQRMPELPIIFLSAKSQKEDVLAGFKAGGNDYIKKPFSMEELMVRIDNILALKNILKKKTGIVQVGDFIFDRNKHVLKIEGQSKQLSYREIEVLNYFIERKNQEVKKKEMLLHIWGDDNHYNSRNLDVYVRKLRTHLSKDPNISLITLRAVGYKFIVGD